MKIENQVCTLEQAKRLKELGVEQSGVMMYYNSSVGVVLLHKVEKATLDNEWCAFTVAELGEMLPTYEDGVGKYYTIKDVGKLSGDNSNYDVVGWNISESYPEEPHHLIDNLMNCVHATEAQARAAMLIYLLENNLMTAYNPIPDHSTPVYGC